MEKVSYDELRRWFWVRTCIWTVAAAIASAMTFFGYASDIVKAVEARAWVSIGSGLGVVLIGLLAALISLEFAWMRRGWRIAFLLNGACCAAISALVAFLICGVILTFMQNDPMHLPSARLVSTTYALMHFGVGAAAFWGFIYGSWFALRRDRYFVEQI